MLNNKRAERDEIARIKGDNEFLQARKMEVLGRLASGITHDFNNLLTVIGGYAELLVLRSRREGWDCEECEAILTATRHAAALTRHLLAFSRKEVTTLSVLDVNQVIAETGRMLRRLMPENVRLVIDSLDQKAFVLADRVQAEQLVLNLVLNARDAMPQGGLLTVSTHALTVGEEGPEKYSVMSPGEYVQVTVKDSGVGMDKETSARIFEPFFTTKATGEGTGLGLAIVYSIVKQSRGFIWVDSNPNRGSTFEIYLPRVHEQEVIQTVPHAGQHKSSPGKGTILLVEDEDSLRGLLADYLRNLGYSVLTAEDGIEAAKIARECQTTIHLLLTDLFMPKMDGNELASSLGSMFPRLKVLYISGDSDKAIVGRLGKDTHFLQKPFGLQAFADKVQELLAGPTEVSANDAERTI